MAMQSSCSWSTRPSPRPTKHQLVAYTTRITAWLAPRSTPQMFGRRMRKESLTGSPILPRLRSVQLLVAPRISGERHHIWLTVTMVVSTAGRSFTLVTQVSRQQNSSQRRRSWMRMILIRLFMITGVKCRTIDSRVATKLPSIVCLNSRMEFRLGRILLRELSKELLDFWVQPLQPSP